MKPENCTTPEYHRTHRYCPSCTWTEQDGKPPLTCGFCGAKRWNDETVSWLPLSGDHRVPYCAHTCARWVMTIKADRELVLPDLFVYVAALEADIQRVNHHLARIRSAASVSVVGEQQR